MLFTIIHYNGLLLFFPGVYKTIVFVEFQGWEAPGKTDFLVSEISTDMINE